MLQHVCRIDYMTPHITGCSSDIDITGKSLRFTKALFIMIKSAKNVV